MSRIPTFLGATKWTITTHTYTTSTTGPFSSCSITTSSCEWNRQIASWVMKPWQTRASLKYKELAFAREDLEMDTEVHACPDGCSLLHLNGLKCAGKLLLHSSGGCATWRAVIERMERGDNTSCPEPRDFRWLGPYRLLDRTRPNSKRKRTSKGRIRRMGIGEQGRAVAAGLRKWFGTCCRG